MLHEYGVYGWSPTEPSAYWPVGTSGLYAAVFHITGVSFGAIAILNVILSTLTVFMSAILAQRLFGPEVGVVTGYIMAVWPAEICFVTVLASEIPFIFFVLLGLAAWQCGSPTTFYARAVISGLCFGLACYFRPVATIVPFVLVLASMPKANFRCRAFRGGIICMLVLTVAVAPWAYRNT
jgi:4-amino-4-deoxy-L-arabinose transferase-like glycosyltransferase